MLGFAPLSATPLSALPIAGSTYAAESLGIVSKFGTPVAIWDQFCDVSGFAPVQFGTPTHRRTQPVSGFAPVQFGTPAGYKLQRVQGFAPVLFGVPYLHPSHVAPWPVSSQFGGVGGHQFWRAPTMAVVTRLGTPTTPTNRTGPVSGFAPVRFGTPLATRRNTGGVGTVCTPSGFTATGLGSPSVRRTQYGAAQPIVPIVHVGAPAGSTVHHAAGISPAQLGEPTCRRTQRTTGFGLAVLGAPAATLTQHAAGAAPKARFGVPRTIRSDWYEARGFCPLRAGTPRGYQRNNRRADGFSPVLFGSPNARETRRVSSTPPTCHLGVPLLRRNTQC